MVSTLAAPQNLITDDWVQSTWEDFLEVCARPDLEKARCYYDSGWMRIETMTTGARHSDDNTLLVQVVSLFGMVRKTRLKGLRTGVFGALG
jgi:Uma2 family endonuclease